MIHYKGPVSARVKSHNLDEEQYRLLCETCDRVLLARDATTECIAMPWLHVIRGHPMLATNYAELFESGQGMRQSGREWIGIMRGKAAWLGRLIKGFQFSRVVLGMPYKSAKSNRCPVCIPLGKYIPCWSGNGFLLW